MFPEAALKPYEGKSWGKYKKIVSNPRERHDQTVVSCGAFPLFEPLYLRKCLECGRILRQGSWQRHFLTEHPELTEVPARGAPNRKRKSYSKRGPKAKRKRIQIRTMKRTKESIPPVEPLTPNIEGLIRKRQLKSAYMRYANIFKHTPMPQNMRREADGEKKLMAKQHGLKDWWEKIHKRLASKEKQNEKVK